MTFKIKCLPKDFIVDEIAALPLRKKEEYPSKKKNELQFFLPRGSSVRLLVQRLFRQETHRIKFRETLLIQQEGRFIMNPAW